MFTVLIRFLLINVNLFRNIEFIFYIGGVASIFWGTVSALKQKRLKKLFIYSSIVQLGFILIALSSFSKDSIAAIYFFLIIYNFTAVLGWGILTAAYGFQKQILFFRKQKMFPVFLSSFINLFKTNKI